MTASCELEVRVIPNASRDEITGWHNGVLKIKTSAQPESGKANKAVCLILAKALKVPKRAVSVVRGQTSQRKCLSIGGLAEDELKARLSF